MPELPAIDGLHIGLAVIVLLNTLGMLVLHFARRRAVKQRHATQARYEFEVGLADRNAATLKTKDRELGQWKDYAMNLDDLLDAARADIDTKDCQLNACKDAIRRLRCGVDHAISACNTLNAACEALSVAVPDHD